MRNQDKTKAQLIAELEELRGQLDSLEAAAAAGRTAEAELRHEHRLAQQYPDVADGILRSMQDGLAVLDRNGVHIDVNDAFCRMTGFSREELIGVGPPHPYWPPEAHAAIEKAFEDCTRGPRTPVELTFMRKNGVRFPVLIAPSVVKDKNGNVVSHFGTFKDLTERKLAEEALKKIHDELEEKVKERTAELSAANEGLRIFQQFAEASGQGFSMADLDGRLLYMNPAFCRMLGTDRPEECIGRHLSICYSDETNRRGREEIEPYLKKHGQWEGELSLLSRQGKTVPTWHHAFLIRDASGNPLRRAVVITDISERKQAEEALRQSEERYDLVVRGTGVGIFDWNILAGTVYYSPRWKTLFGYDELDIGGAVEDWASRLHPDERDSIVQRQDDFFAGTSLTATAEYRLRHKDGSYRWIKADVLVVRDGKGKAIRLVGSHGDITERKQAEEALERERQSLWNMLQASDHERQIISYEIHDGLAQYLAAAGMQLQMFTHLQESSPEEARTAYDAAEQLVRQAHSESRRLISGVRPPVLDEAGLEMAISHLVHDRRVLKGPKIEYKSEVQFSRLPSILEDSLYRIAQEALTNACKHSKSKKVTVALIQEIQDVRLQVRDTGIGFDPEAVEKGHFGLESIRQRVRLLGGRLKIESKPGRGTLVQAIVPIVEKKSET